MWCCLLTGILFSFELSVNKNTVSLWFLLLTLGVHLLVSIHPPRSISSHSCLLMLLLCLLASDFSLCLFPPCISIRLKLFSAQLVFFQPYCWRLWSGTLLILFVDLHTLSTSLPASLPPSHRWPALNSPLLKSIQERPPPSPPPIALCL